ncbi:unnamed protein product, partial [Durusdinium trenchii]
RQLQASNWKRMKGTRKKYMDLEEALGHIDLTMWLATFQDDTGSYYGFEHPEKSLAWKRESVQKLLERPGNQLATFDQCQFGLVSPSGKPMQKRTKFMTNLGPLFNALNGKFCDHSHEHELIQGSENGVKRSAWAQTYPDGL